MGPRPVLDSLDPQEEAPPDPSLLYESPSNLRSQSRLQGESSNDGISRESGNAFTSSRGRGEEFQIGTRRGRTGSPRSLSADRCFSSVVRKNFAQQCSVDPSKQKARFSNLFDDAGSTESSSVDMHPADRRPVSAPNSFADIVESRGGDARRFLRKGSYDSTRTSSRQVRAASGSHRKVPVFYSESAADMQKTWGSNRRKAFPHLLQSTGLGDEDDDTDADEDLLHWRGWRELLAERQREMERHMCEERRELNKQDTQAECERPAFRRRKAPKSDTPVSSLMDVEEDEDPLGIKSRHTGTPRGRVPPAGSSGFGKGEDVRPESRKFIHPAQLPSPMAGPGAIPPAGGPPLPQFFGPFVSPNPYFPGWPPPYYAAAVAAAAAVRKAGEKAGITGQETIQNLKKALDETNKEMKAKEEERKKELEEEREKHRVEKEGLEKQLGEVRETAEQRARALVGAELKHGELEKQIKMLRDEFDILSRVHAELKEQFEREKEAMVAEKNSLLTKVRDLENDLSFSKDQLLVARESLIAARTKQQAATDAHEEDLKALQEYRRENEALKEDVKYQRTLNLSLSEKVQRLMEGRSEAKDLHAGSGVQPHASGTLQLKKKSPGLSRDQASSQPPPSALHQLFSPQVQQRLLKDRAEEARAAGEHCTLKEATYTLPPTKQGSRPGSFGHTAESESMQESSLPSQSPGAPAFPYSEEHAVPRAHRLSSVEMRFLAHLHQSEPATTPVPLARTGAAEHDRISKPFHGWPQHNVSERAMGCRDSPPWLPTIPPNAHPGIPNCSSMHPFSQGLSSVEGTRPAASANSAPRYLVDDISRPQQAGSQDDNSVRSEGTELEDQTPFPKGCKLRCDMQSRPPIFPPLPFADRVPTGGSTSRGGSGEVLRNPFPHMSFQAANTVASTTSSVTEGGLPGSAKPYVCTPSKPPPLQSTKHLNAEQSLPSPPRSTSPTSGLMSFPGSAGPSGLNSARTQWLLQRVSRISRLHGLQSIHDKLKDFPPAFLAASNAPDRSTGNRERRRLHSTDAKGESGFDSSVNGKTAQSGATFSTVGFKDSESADGYPKRTETRGCSEPDVKTASADDRFRVAPEENPWTTAAYASHSRNVPTSSPTPGSKRTSSGPRSAETPGDCGASVSAVSSRHSAADSKLRCDGRVETVRLSNV